MYAIAQISTIQITKHKKLNENTYFYYFISLINECSQLFAISNDHFALPVCGHFSTTLV